MIFLGTTLQIHLVCGLCRLSNPLNAPNLHTLNTEGISTVFFEAVLEKA